MKKTFWMVAGLLLTHAMPAHALFGRDGISSLWPSTTVQIDARSVEWPEMPLLDEHGMGFHAMNDNANLYFLIEGTAADGRLLLSGKSGQTITIWFLKPDGKTRAWGLLLDFSHAQETDIESPTTLADWGIAAQQITPQGSTTTLPAGLEFQADLSSQRGRQPLYEMRIPLTLLEYNDRSVDLDFVATDVSNEKRAGLLAPTNEPPKLQKEESASPPTGGGGGHGGRHHHGGGGVASAVDLPKRLNLRLRIALAKEPKR